MPQSCYLAKGAKRPSHTTNTIKFDRVSFDPCNSIKRFDLCFLTRQIWPIYSHPYYNMSYQGVAVNRSNFFGRKDWGRTFWSNYRDRTECCRILSYLLYGSVASLPSPSSNIEAWPDGTSLRFASLRSCIQGTRGMWTHLTTLLKVRSELFRSHSKIWYCRPED